jgi:predicted nucleotidyltransferase
MRGGRSREDGSITRSPEAQRVNINYPPGISRLPLHKARLEAVCVAAMREQRIVAMSLWGSFVTGTADWYSDLDLALVSEDDDVQHVIRSAREIAEASGPVVAACTRKGEPNLLVVLYDDLLHVDLTAVGLSELAKWTEHSHHMLWERTELSSLVGQAGEDTEEEGISHSSLDEKPDHFAAEIAVLDQRMWTWVWYTQAKILRGEVWEAYDSINYMRTYVLFPLVRITRGVDGKKSRRIDELIGDRREQFVRTLPAPSREAALKALQRTVALYLDLIDPILADQGVEPAAAARRAVGEALAEGLEWRPPSMSASSS